MPSRTKTEIPAYTNSLQNKTKRETSLVDRLVTHKKAEEHTHFFMFNINLDNKVRVSGASCYTLVTLVQIMVGCGSTQPLKAPGT